MEGAPSNRHVVAIHRAPGGYFARVLGLPGCIARGATEVEAIENVREMIRLHETIARLAAAERPRVSLEISA
jgi:predicted RNase H-like HicB family nuclease